MDRIAVAGAAVANAALLAGCAGAADAGVGAAPPAGSTPPTARPVAVSRVSITSFAFSPQVVTVKVGATLEWTNRDTEPHTVTAPAAGSGPASQPLSQGATYRYTFGTAGRFDYLCTIHPFMTGTVVVTP